MKQFAFLLLALVFSISANAQKVIGQFKSYVHIGNPGAKGTVNYDSEIQEYTLEGASGNMWADHDDFHFLWKKMKGNFILQAQVEFVGNGVEPHRKVGWMVR